MSPWPIYVISLRPEFWARLDKQARAMGLFPACWAGTDGKSIDLDAWRRDGQFEPATDPAERPMTRGEVGCSYSHQRIWAHVIAAGLPGALILEDDAELPPGLPQWLERAQRHAREWDILYLGFTQWARTQPVEHAPGFVIPDLAGGWHVMHAYLVTRAGAQGLLSGALPIRAPVDLYVSKLTQSRVRAWQTQEPVVGVCAGTFSSTQGIA